MKNTDTIFSMKSSLTLFAGALLVASIAFAGVVTIPASASASCTGSDCGFGWYGGDTTGYNDGYYAGSGYNDGYYSGNNSYSTDWYSVDTYDYYDQSYYNNDYYGYYQQPYYYDYGYNYNYNYNYQPYNPPPHYNQPTCAISADTTSINDNQSVTLHWTSEGATSATLSNYGSVSTGGSMTVSPNSTTTYTLRVSGQGGSSSCSATIYVNQHHNNNTPSCDLSVSDSHVSDGDRITLSWDTNNADYASINQGIGRVDENGGSRRITINDDTTFRMTVRNADGDEDTCSASVFVDNNNNNFSSVVFTGGPVNNPPTVYLSQLPYTGVEDMSPSLIASLVMLVALAGIGGYFFFVKRTKVA